MVSSVVEELGPPDILVNNAGIASRYQAVIDLDPAHFDVELAGPILAANCVASPSRSRRRRACHAVPGRQCRRAALATAIALTVVEPVMNGIGGDMFAHRRGTEASCTASTLRGARPPAGRPTRFKGCDKMPATGWDSVTVPGAVAGWMALTSGSAAAFARLFEPAIRYAQEGFMVSPAIARQWAAQVPGFIEQPGFREAFTLDGRRARGRRACSASRTRRSTLQPIAASGGESFLPRRAGGARSRHLRRSAAARCARAISPRTAPNGSSRIAQSFPRVTLHEIPPNGQGLAALIALGILDHFDLEGHRPRQRRASPSRDRGDEARARRRRPRTSPIRRDAR